MILRWSYGKSHRILEFFDVLLSRSRQCPYKLEPRRTSFRTQQDFLSDCHRRIEMFLGALEGVGSLIDRPLTKETRVALESALRYFREAAPKHTADEEESLFPRLRKMHPPDVEAAIARLDPLEHDHLLAGSLQAEVEELGQRYISVGSLESTGVEAFRKAIASLVSIYSSTSGSRTSWYFLWRRDSCLQARKQPLQAKWLLAGTYDSSPRPQGCPSKKPRIRERTTGQCIQGGSLDARDR